MKIKTRTNIKRLTLSLGILVVLLCLSSYASAPQSASFVEAFNPWSTLVGLAFVLTYFGLPVAASAAIVVLLLLLALWGVFALVRRLLKPD